MEKSLPVSGSITPVDKDVTGGKTIQITATYTDKGGIKRKPLSGVDVLYIEPVKK